MFKVYLIRHSFTEGNLNKRYIGTTDEPLCEKGVNILKDITYPPVDKLIVSPLKRCIETAEKIFPDKKYSECPGMRECNFGDFENKNYIELSDNDDYQKWIDSNGKMPFPNGESTEEFKERCINSFLKEIDNAVKEGCSSAALVVHGGTIMSIMQFFMKNESDFYKYNLKNAEGYELTFDEVKWQKGVKELEELRKMGKES